MIGVFGGTFDPVHFGHLRTAFEVRQELGIGDFRLLPAGDPPHRQGPVTQARHRLAMLRLAVAGYGGFALDEREVLRPGPSYMSETLADLRSEAGRLPLLLIVGQDTANGLDRWHDWRSLFGLAHIVVMQRPDHAGGYSKVLAKELEGRWTDRTGDLEAAPAGRVLGIEVTPLRISSSDIREMVRSGRSPRFLVPEAVLDYIHSHGLYREARADPANCV